MFKTLKLVEWQKLRAINEKIILKTVFQLIKYQQKLWFNNGLSQQWVFDQYWSDER